MNDTRSPGPTPHHLKTLISLPQSIFKVNEPRLNAEQQWLADLPRKTAKSQRLPLQGWWNSIQERHLAQYLYAASTMCACCYPEAAIVSVQVTLGLSFMSGVSCGVEFVARYHS